MLKSESPVIVENLTPTQKRALVGLDGSTETKPLEYFLVDHVRAMPSLMWANLVEQGTIAAGRGGNRDGGKMYWLTKEGQRVVDLLKGNGLKQNVK